jgi:hypothetical protein
MIHDRNTLSEARETTSPQIAGLTSGTVLMTLRGATAVEDLKAGDRLITRSGAVAILNIRSETLPVSRMIRISASAIDVEKPVEDMLVVPDQEILIRDWRAKALRGADQAIVAARKLIDGEYIRAEQVQNLCLYSLEFAAPVVLYAGGVELACSGGASAK